MPKLPAHIIEKLNKITGRDFKEYEEATEAAEEELEKRQVQKDKRKKSKRKEKARQNNNRQIKNNRNNV